MFLKIQYLLQEISLNPFLVLQPVPEERDNINGMHQLSVEATAINQNFSQQVLLGGPARFDTGEPNPFTAEEQGELAPVAYK